MSAHTKQALDDAIAAHIADEAGDGQMVTGYSLIVAHADADDFDQEVTRYFAEYADRQPFHTALGLIHRHRMILEAQTLAEG